MKNTKRIDQEKRARLCREILSGKADAAAELAELYRKAGYEVLANSIASVRPEAVQQHARMIAEG